MRVRPIVIALTALALGACDAGRVTGAASDAVRPRPDTGPRASLDGEYWSEAEYEAAGGAAATELESEYTTTSGFSGNWGVLTRQAQLKCACSPMWTLR